MNFLTCKIFRTLQRKPQITFFYYASPNTSKKMKKTSWYDAIVIALNYFALA